MLTKLISKTSIYYTIFESLSKGGNYVLLMAIAFLIDSDLYVKIILLLSFEALITMLYFSYNSDVLFALSQNKKERYIAYSYDTSIIQCVLLFVILFALKTYISRYFEYDVTYILIFIIGNGALSNIFRFQSLSFQIDHQHNQALKFKSIPFFLSFIFCLILILLCKDKVLAFFVGKFIGYLLFFLYVIFYENIKANFFSTSLLMLSFMLRRAKYSFLIAFLGWGTSLGFMNYAKLTDKNNTYLITLGLLINMFSILLVFANGINQVVAPNLRSMLRINKEEAVSYIRRIHLLYFSITIILVVLIAIIKSSFSVLTFLTPEIEHFLSTNYLYILPVIFFAASFSWISGPIYVILDKFKQYSNNMVALNILGWMVIILLSYFDLTNIIFEFVLIRTIIPIGLSILLNRNILNIWR